MRHRTRCGPVAASRQTTVGTKDRSLHMLRARPERTRTSLVAALAVVFALQPLSIARAAVLDNDYVGGVQVRVREALRVSAPDLSMPSGTLSSMDGRELWSRDPAAQRAMASTTKIMTAVVVLERASLDDIVTVDKRSATVGQSAMGLVVGERLTVGELLKGVLVQSGNDAAVLIAEYVGGSVEGFVRLMNEKAAALDLLDTRFANPHGLDQAGHYTSAADLTSLARYAMRNPVFRQIVGTYTLKVRSDHYTHVLTNHNVLLKTYKGAEGIKTGWTDDAGYCVVVAAQRNGVELIGTVMGAASEQDRARQAKKLLDWGFAHYRPVVITTAGEVSGRVPVSDYLERTVGARAVETTSIPVFDLAGAVRRRVELLPDVPAPVKAGDRVGTLTVFQGKAMLAQVPLVADADIPAPSIGQRVVFFFARIWKGIFGA
jgi:D-alanyl-D-alanine carboxypeptidase (penicillin-binding protein 5/6)